MRNSNTEDENAMTGNDPVWETFVLLAHAYGPTKAHSLTSEAHGADRANRYRNRYIDTYGRRCRDCGGVTYADDEWEPHACAHCGSKLD